MDSMIDARVVVVETAGGTPPMARRREPPEGWVTQAFQFAVDLTDEQRSLVHRQFGGRRFAFNWTLRTLTADIERYHTDGAEAESPSHYGMRKRWNEAKPTVCVDSDSGEVWCPKIGTVRLHENARRLERLIGLGRARVLSMTVRRHGDRVLVSLVVDVMRPQRHHKPTQPASRVGVDVGVRRLATIANSDGVVLERVANPAPLKASLAELRRLCRQRTRRIPGSVRYRAVNRRISVLHARISNIRRHHISVLTTNLAKTHGEVVVEGLDVAAMLQQKGLNGARARRRGMSDAALAEPRRQLRYKCRWYGSELVEADRFFPSSKSRLGGSGHRRRPHRHRPRPARALTAVLRLRDQMIRSTNSPVAGA